MNRMRNPGAVAATMMTMLMAAGCNSRQPLVDSPATPSSVLAELPGVEVGIYSVTFEPTGINGGSPTQGTVTLTVPAPSEGLAVALASSDSSVSVPASVMVPAGALFVHFPVSTQMVAQDAIVDVTASVSGSSRGGPLSVWAMLPTFVSWTADLRDERFWPPVGRITPPATEFKAFREGNQVRIDMQPAQGIGSRSLLIAAPVGEPLAPGVYDVPQESALDKPRLLHNLGRGCTQTGARFVVNEAEFNVDGSIHHFWATFETYCFGGYAPLRGEVRLTDVPHVFGGGTASLQ